jgi:hypothetical protein
MANRAATAIQQAQVRETLPPPSLSLMASSSWQRLKLMPFAPKAPL